MRSIRVIALTMLLGTQAACLGKFGLHAPAVTSDAAKVLVAAERSVMLQPEQDMQSGVGADYIVRCKKLDPCEHDDWRSPYRFFEMFPNRIEVAPGKHRFEYNGGQSWLGCIFDVSLEPGHVYKPQALNSKFVGPLDCTNQLTAHISVCTITLSDTAPDGGQTDLELDCLHD